MDAVHFQHLHWNDYKKVNDESGNHNQFLQYYNRMSKLRKEQKPKLQDHAHLQSQPDVLTLSITSYWLFMLVAPAFHEKTTTCK